MVSKVLTIGTRVRLLFPADSRLRVRPMAPVLGSVVRHIPGRGYVVRHDAAARGQHTFWWPYGAIEELPE